MKKFGILALGIVVLLSACSKKQLEDGSVNLSDLRVGQKSIFQMYQSDCGDLDGEFSFSGDELELEVIEENGQLFLRETLLEGSPLLAAGMPSPIQYSIETTGDYALIPDRWSSYLFYFYGNDTIRLTANPNVKLQQTGCTLRSDGLAFVGDDIGKVDKIKVGDVVQRSKTVVSCLPNFFWSMDAYLVYDECQLWMSHRVNSEDSMVEGWVLKDSRL